MKVFQRSFSLFILLCLGLLAPATAKAVCNIGGGDPANCSIRNLDDNGNGSLRLAISEACATPGDDDLDFARIGSSGLINLASPIEIPSTCNGKINLIGRETIHVGLNGSSLSAGQCALVLGKDNAMVHHLSFISANKGICIRGNNITVQQNYIGAGPLSSTTKGGVGIEVTGSNASIYYNVIGNTNVAGIHLSGASNTKIQANYIGADHVGANLGNSGPGILINASASGAQIGGLTGPYDTASGVGQLPGQIDGQGNVIRFNNIGILAAGTGSNRNKIQFNNISNNVGLGIDLSAAPSAGDGVTDMGTATNGGNNLILPPKIMSIPSSPGAWIIAGTATPGSTVEVYKVEASETDDSSNHGEGAYRLGSANVGPGGHFNVTVAGAGLVNFGDRVSATATTSADGTSEFSGNVRLIDHEDPEIPSSCGTAEAECTSGPCCDVATCRWKAVGDVCEGGAAPGTCDASHNCVQPTSCGNHIVEAPEQCDDGNTANGDGCSSTCNLETPALCGNGILNPGETCDDGGTTAGDGCSATCQLENPALCGNGTVNPGEQCDDGGTMAGDGCGATCQLENLSLCGNHVVDPGETCDDGNTANGDCCSKFCQKDPVGTTCSDGDAGTDPDTCNGSAVCTGTPVPITPPTELVAATNATDPAHKITLNWRDQSNNEEGYKIERSDDCATFTQIATVAGSVGTGNFIPYVDSGLTPNHTYCYRVRAYLGSSNSLYSNIDDATTFQNPSSVPSNPSAISATPISATQINVSWLDNSLDESGFELERAPGACGASSSFMHIADLGANVTNYSDTGLNPATTYCYRVRAKNSVGNSAYTTPPAQATTFGPGTVVPTGTGSTLVATALTPTSVSLNWIDNSTNEDNYVVERQLNCAGAWTTVTATLPANTTNYVDTGLTPNTIYCYKVHATNGAGSSPDSNIASAHTPPVSAVVPSNPSTLTATAISATQVDLSWTDTSNNEDGFKVERSVGDCSSFIEIAVVGANVTSFHDFAAAPNTTYCYRVRAFNSGGGNSGYSNNASATTPAGTTVPAAPSNLTATPNSPTQVTLTWTDNSDNEQSYVVERAPGTCLAPSGPFVVIGNTGAIAGSGSTATYVDVTASPSTTYCYRVKAHNLAGDSPYSVPPAQATTPATVTLPSAPSNTTATANAPTQVTVTWTDNSNNETGYVIERAPGTCAAPGAFVVVGNVGPVAGTGSTGTFTDTTVTGGQTYCYRVKATNSAGDSAYGIPPAQATTPVAPTSPTTPSNVNATPNTPTQITITWTDNSNNEGGFIIERAPGTCAAPTGPFVVVGNVGAINVPPAGGTGTFTDTTVTPGTTYCYHVIAVGIPPAPNSPPSTGVTVTTPVAGVCGNNIKESGEACDDGNAVNSDGCSSTCNVEPGYVCTGNPSVCVKTCGNGTLEVGEACDDGNPNNGDGCSATCVQEPGYVCSGAPSTCVKTCGNGTLDAGEACDDGNKNSNDGCSSSCVIENGYVCNGTPSVCVPNPDCGNGSLNGSEACDDGNKQGGDGCSANCGVEDGFTCSNNPLPSTCTPTNPGVGPGPGFVGIQGSGGCSMLSVVNSAGSSASPMSMILFSIPAVFFAVRRRKE